MPSHAGQNGDFLDGLPFIPRPPLEAGRERAAPRIARMVYPPEKPAEEEASGAWMVSFGLDGDAGRDAVKSSCTLLCHCPPAPVLVLRHSHPLTSVMRQG